jgi:GT2 family glycosyltransferase
VQLDVVLVGNGCRPDHVPDGVRCIALPDNVGVPAGRNAGVRAVSGDLLFFLDDDACLADEHTLLHLAERFEADPGLGAVQPRIVDPASGTTLRRWVPRLHVGDPSRSSEICALWEGVVAMRRDVFDAVGGWPDEFFYMHEGIDLAWRVWDSGRTVRYAGNVVANHPVVSHGRHPTFHRMNSRNRVFLARRLLPLPVGAMYLTVWALRTTAAIRSTRDVVETVRGVREGFVAPCGSRHPIGWATVWRMTLAGRPPVV